MHADPYEIQFIIANFIKNSLSAIEGKKDGAIQVRISDLGESWKVSVSDNGPGISDETLIRLRKGEAGQSSKTDGLGFGLAIASMLAERNGGHLEYNQPRAGGLEALSVKITFATLSVLHGVVKHAIFAGVYR